MLVGKCSLSLMELKNFFYAFHMSLWRKKIFLGKPENRRSLLKPVPEGSFNFPQKEEEKKHNLVVSDLANIYFKNFQFS